MFDRGKKDKTHATPVPLAQKDRDKRFGDGADSSGSRSHVQSDDIAVIGRSIKIDGDLCGEEDLRIEGDVSGTIQLPNHSLTIGTEGRINADAYAKTVTVDGEINGDLFGSECVRIRANARVAGNVVALRVSVEEGAHLKGSIDMDPKSVEAALGSKREVPASVTSAERPKSSTQTTAAASSSNMEKPAGVQNLTGDKKSKVGPAH